jgi:protein PhnA
MTVRDSNGNELVQGDAVQVIKDLRVKGSSDTLKRGTTFKNIRLIDGDDAAIECGQGRNTVVLKTEFLRKVASH